MLARLDRDILMTSVVRREGRSTEVIMKRIKSEQCNKMLNSCESSRTSSAIVVCRDSAREGEK